jgi:Epoxide hydrolase N terminus
MTKRPKAFKLAVPDADIADLRERLKRTRYPDQAPAPAWAHGTDVAWMRGLTIGEKNSIGALKKAVSTFSLNTKWICIISICISSMSRGGDRTPARFCYPTVGRAPFLNFLS